jgi:lysophospholipase L1-like esterase
MPVSRWISRIARLAGAIVGAFIGVVAVQLLRLRRAEFLPGHPGFYVNLVLYPADGGGADRPALRMLAFGDSTAAGVGVDRPEDALPALIAQLLADRRGQRVHVTSYGWAGARVADLVRDQLPRAMGPLRAGETTPVLPRADVVAVIVGANDATHRTAPWRYRTDLRASLETIHAAAPRAEVVLVGIPYFRGALRHMEPLMWLTEQFARTLRPISRAEASRAGAAYADLAGKLRHRMRGRPDALSADRFHPSVVGYAAWADVTADALHEARDGATDLAPLTEGMPS